MQATQPQAPQAAQKRRPRTMADAVKRRLERPVDLGLWATPQRVDAGRR